MHAVPCLSMLRAFVYHLPMWLKLFTDILFAASQPCGNKKNKSWKMLFLLWLFKCDTDEIWWHLHVTNALNSYKFFVVAGVY